jgi:hypothetical protein
VLIDAGLEEDHRRMLAYAVVGMAEGASRYYLDRRGTMEPASDTSEPTNQAPRLASRVADLAWAGLRSVHRD